MKINKQKLEKSLPITKDINPKKHKFFCRHCNKPYPSIELATSCSCEKKIKWNSPFRARNFEESRAKTRPLPIKEIKKEPETRRHFKIIKKTKTIH